jgi:hypothetical protein
MNSSPKNSTTRKQSNNLLKRQDYRNIGGKMRNNGFEGEEFFYHNQKVHPRSFLRRYFWQTVAAVALLIALISTSITVLLFINSQHSLTTNPEIKPNNVSLKEQSVSTPTSIAAPTQQPIATPTSVATPTSTSIQLNRALTCVNQTHPCHFKIVVTTATINNDEGQTTLTFQIKSTSYSGSANVTNLYFVDSSGKQYSPSGQLTISSNAFTISQEAQLTLNATYSFIPQSNTIYTLSTAIYDNDYVNNTYQDEQFSFQKS